MRRLIVRPQTGKLSIKNPEGNAYPVNVEIKDDQTGKMIYTSGAILPGEEVDQIHLEQSLAKGSHKTTATFSLYDAKTKKKQGEVSAGVTITVNYLYTMHYFVYFNILGGKDMKKLLAVLMTAGIALCSAPLVFAADGTEGGGQHAVVGESTADIEVNGTLGADNTDPSANIPEGDDNWINVTVPTKSNFYNTASDKKIKAPNYSIVNNSGRPVKVTANGFVANGSQTLPSDFGLNLDVKGTADNTPTTPSVNLIKDGALVPSISSDLITLANDKNQQQASDPASDTPVNNKATFTYSGEATATSQANLKYTLNLKFDAVKWE